MITDEAILLRKIKYGDSGLILKLFTKGHGNMSFLLQGIKGKNKALASMLFPLASLQIVFNEKSRGDLKRIKELQLTDSLFSLRTQIQKSSLAFFLADVTGKCLMENEKQVDLFNFIQTAVQLLENSNKIGNFHLIYLVRLSQFLGFSPVGNFTGREFFDLQEGLFTRLRPTHLQYLEKLEAKRVSEIITHGFDFLEEPLTRTERSNILDGLVKYFQIHIDSFGAIKSLEVLRQLSQ